MGLGLGSDTLMKICFVSLGCDKNLVDTEKMLGILNSEGYELTDDEESADAVIVNTCCFIHDAKKESIETLLQLSEMKQNGNLKFLIAAGCLAQRYKDEIIKEIPEVDAVIGTYACGEIAAVIRSLENREKGLVRTGDRYEDHGDIPRMRSSISHYSYLKIAEGCDKRCTYCIIPYIRGTYRSEPMERLVDEARRLADSGVNELILVAQETTIYGSDIYGKNMIGELIDRLCSIEGIRWIRIMYCYPEEIGEELINAFKKQPKLCRYIDMPIQHISDRILQRMGRRTNGTQIRNMIERLRREAPGIAIRTSLIAGFPGETEEDHRELVKFIEDYKLDRVGVFTYSREEDTPAAKMKDQIRETVKKKRRKELMLAQQKVVFEKNEALKDRVFTVMIDGKISGEDVYIGRTYMDAPDIDGSVFVESGKDLISGTLLNVRIRDYNGYDLIGTEVEEDL